MKKIKLSEFKGKMMTLMIFILIWSFDVSGQQVFRRHFIIAYDISSPFIKAERNCYAYEKALIALFSNQQVYVSEAYQDNLKVEKTNGVPFFDKDRDEISFFHFNIARSEFTLLNNENAIRSGENKIVSDFNSLFIKNKQWSWSNNKQRKITDYFRKALSITPTPADFGLGVSMSNFVYPLALDKIDANKYAEEYILVILSDFLTGSMLGNTKDLERVRDIYSIGYDKILPDDSPVSFIKKRIDYLASQYYKIDFFQYSFPAIIPPSNRIGILAYKIKPKTGVLTPEDVALFVDSDLNLYQQGYQSPKFKTNEAKLKFTHNKHLVSTELRMTISLPDKSAVLFEDVIASKNSENEWISNYTNNVNLMKRDSLNYTYYIPVLNISLDSAIINGKNFSELKFDYVFKTKYEIENAQSLNFIYKTERALTIENIDYTTKATIIIMYYLLPIAAFLLLLIILIKYGKPRKLEFTLDGYLDSFEKVDFQNEGKTNTPYKPWDYEKDGKVDFLPVKGTMKFKSPKYPFNWDSSVRLQLIVDVIPKGFELFLKHKPDGNEFSPDLPPISIRKGRNNALSFLIGIRQADINKQINKPELVKFHIEAVVDDSFLFIKSNIRQTAIKYKFLIGPDLQNVWVAFDPGTSGSCVAVGSAPNNIILSKNRWEQEISPSVIVFDKTSDYKQTTPTENVSSYGELAERRIKDTDRFAGYRSFKKLLGFKDEQKIIFTNSNKLSLKGRDLAALLVKGLYKDLETYVNNHPDADEYKRGEQGSKKFNPLRAVVTIPNNFTASKIQDMIYCIDNLKQFKEIRYVYEAEAVLFYYLSHYGKYNDNRSFNAPENILIFDMGGATINATIVAANKTSANYNIDFLGKIGYGIGGDTIDYCIIKFLMINLSELRGINIFDKKTKEKLIPSILQIKQEMFANYSNNRVKKFLIEPNQLSTFVNDILEIKDDDKKIIIDENRLIFQYLKSEDGAIALQKFFANIIYQNIKDAINELMELSGNVTIDKIIFSGRSTIFPMIKETVEQTLKAKKINAKRIIFDKVDKSKTVVAEGACWYGVNKNSVHLNNRKTNSSFGFMRTLSADRNDINFSTLIKMGSVFNEKDDGINFILGIEKIADNFNFDSNQVNFYQIMGKDAKAILSGKQKHKFSKVAAIQIHQPTVQVGMQVSENDVVDCKVQLNSNRVLQEHGFVTDQEISDANEEHYTWMVE